MVLNWISSQSFLSNCTDLLGCQVINFVAEKSCYVTETSCWVSQEKNPPVMQPMLVCRFNFSKFLSYSLSRYANRGIIIQHRVTGSTSYLAKGTTVLDFQKPQIGYWLNVVQSKDLSSMVSSMSWPKQVGSRIAKLLLS